VDYEEAGEIVARGSKASVLMAPWARWNVINCKTGPSQGVAMPLASRVGKTSSAAWAACDPTLRGQVINVGGEERIVAKPVKELTWTGHPGLSAASRGKASTASERPIARRELEAEDAKRSAPVKGNMPMKKKKPSKNTDLFDWLKSGVMHAFSSFWLRCSAGGSVAPLLWRAWKFVGSGSVLRAVCDSVLAAGESSEGERDWREEAEEMYE
ncbi:unnamed protein product, partial [Prorocentrum cordatum]